MLDEIVTKLSRAIARSRFLAKSTLACSAVVTAIFGPSRNVNVYTAIGCCDLRHKIQCEGYDPVQWGCAGTWCWTCGTFRISACTIFRCYECYGVDASKDAFNSNRDREHVDSALLGNVVCSKAIDTHIPCWESNRAK